MRLVTVQAPSGYGKKLAEIAFKHGISSVSIYEANVLRPNEQATVKDVFEFMTNTNSAKLFIEEMMDSSIYDPETISFTTRHPESIFSSEPPEKETNPITRPTTDVYEELWQFTLITKSLVGRVLISALLLAYGMREDYMPLIIAGLLFLPYHHHFLGMSLGAGIKEWRFFRQGIYTFLLSTVLIVIGGIGIGLITDPGIKFTAFTKTPLIFSFLLSMIIGIAAALAAVDDGGRRELIGLAATAHVSVYPIWFGMKFIYGFHPEDTPMEFFGIFLMDVSTIIIFSIITFKVMKMRGKGIRLFVKEKERLSG